MIDIWQTRKQRIAMHRYCLLALAVWSLEIYLKTLRSTIGLPHLVLNLIGKIN